MPELSVYDFGRDLIESKDLDPVYVVLWETHLPKFVLHKWLLAYWCFYHCGTACWICSQPSYWEAFAAAAATKEHPRASERRHFRGSQAIKAVQSLRDLQQTPTQIILAIGAPDEKLLLQQVVQRTKKLRGFGDWIAFKVADMLERLDLCPVQFKPEDIFDVFEAPRKGAELMAERHGPAVGNVYTWAHDQLKKELEDLVAPPRGERTIGIQEIETILCKWKSHLNGHYTVGKDIAEVRHGLLKYGTCELSQRLLRGGSRGGLW